MWNGKDKEVTRNTYLQPKWITMAKYGTLIIELCNQNGLLASIRKTLKIHWLVWTKKWQGVHMLTKKRDYYGTVKDIDYRIM